MAIAIDYQSHADWRGFILVKLRYEDKKEIVRLYDKEHYGSTIIARQFHLAETTVKLIIRKYHMHGEEALIKNQIVSLHLSQSWK